MQIVVGVITNSDDRVPDILKSLGVKISPLRYPSKEKLESREKFDIHFSVMSYDVGHEKPRWEMFDAAEDMLHSVLGVTSRDVDRYDWCRVHVGDDYDKDIDGAIASGWTGVLLEREAKEPRDWVTCIDPYENPINGYQYFKQPQVLGARSLERLARWLPGAISH